MKRPLCAVLVVLALPVGLVAFENSPSNYIIIPECVWAAATGGGTWVTEVQITAVTGGSVVEAWFYYNIGGIAEYRFVTLWTALINGHSGKWTNILAAMQSLDPSFTYYGRVGALWLATVNSSHYISAVARISNGNYGKTFPGLQWTDSNTAFVGRNMRIMNVMFSPEYRTFGGFFNAIWGGFSMTCEFSIIGPYNVHVGSTWTETFGPWEFKSFDLFAKAGITTGTYTNHWLLVKPTSAGGYQRGLFCYGSIANNVTNDTYAIIASQFQ